MQPLWCYAGNPVDLDDTNWRITPVDTNAKDSLNPEALHCIPPFGPSTYNRLGPKRSEVRRIKS